LESNSTLHYGSQWDANAYSGGSYKFPAGQSIAGFHVYAVEWEPGEIRFSVEGQTFHTQNDWWSSSRNDGAKGLAPRDSADLNAWPAPFDQPFFIIMNLAVGGDYLGNPDKTTQFPVEMQVDYVRVYDKQGGYGPPVPRGKPKLPFALTHSVQVMSYNIRCGSCEKPNDVNHWSRRKLLVADLIRKSGADLIGLQEAELFQVKDLLGLLDGFDWVGVGRDDGRDKGEMNAVLVRRSAFAIEQRQTRFLSETPEKVSKGWDAMLNRTLTHVQLRSRPTGQVLHWFNTHFDHVGVVARAQSAQLIAKTVASLGPDAAVVVTGDLNGNPDFVGYQTLTQNLRDSARHSITPPTGGDITFNGFGKDLRPGNTIDYIFVSPHLPVQSHRVITDVTHGLYASDHFAVLAQVLLRQVKEP
jgi:endonuclease/exonuclease/phosphatase family metal-dependent hydrolase